LSSEDGEYFNLRISHGEVSFDIYEMEENEVLQLIAVIQNMLYLLKHGGSDDLRERKEASMQECLVE
jgi:hypothetical protein